MAALVALSGPAWAQDTGGDNAAQTEAPAESTAPAPEQPEPPTPYVKESFQDWRIVCVQVNETRESCNMQQLLRDEGNNPVSQVSIAPMPAAAAPRAAAVEVATPLETLLSDDLRVQVDDGTPTRHRFTFCTRQACVSQFALTTQQVGEFKAGAEAKVTITPVVAPDQTVDLTMSLAGFTAAFESLKSQLGE